MTIHAGSQAVPFVLPSKPGEPVDVGAEIGSKTIVLLFFPLAFSPVCTDEMCTMRDNWEQWKSLDASIYGITVDSPFITDKFRDELNIPFPILSDFNREVAPKYGALHDELLGLHGVTKRAAFVIAPSGEIVFDWISDDPRQLPDFEAVRDAVQDAS